MSRLRVVCPFLVMLAYAAAAFATIPGWYAQTNPTSATLNDIQAIDANTAYAVGANGTILKTSDGGATWTKQTSGTTANLSGLYFRDANNGWAAGESTILSTTDGGATWASQTVSAGGIETIAFPSASVGVAVGYVGSQGFLRTADGGAIWTEIDVGNVGSNRPQDVFFIDAQQGWAVGMNADYITTTCDWGSCYTTYHNPKTRMWTTTDGGATWTSTTFASNKWLYGVSFVDANTGWVVGENGLVWHTANGGANWTAQTTGTVRNLYAVDFVDASNGWAAGAYGEIWHTADGGTTWALQVSGVSTNLYAVDFVSATTGWAAGVTLLKTENGGVCTTVINPTSASVSAAGASKTISVTTAGECSWTAASNVPWISITAGASGSGNGTVSYTVEANGGSARQGSLDITGLTFRIVQAGATDELTIRNLAGAGSAQFSTPRGVAADAAGNVYVADSDNHMIRKVTPSGIVTTIAGTHFSGSVDGTGTDARFYGPRDVEVDGAGNVYVADTLNHTIRKITPAGVVTTVAGLAGNSGSSDGTGSEARFLNPRGVAVDGSGNVFVTDTDNHTIRKVTPQGVVTTIAGSPGSAGSADGTGANARFADPERLAIDTSGNLYVADSTNSTIRKITPAGVVTTLAGYAGSTGSFDGTGNGARFNKPGGIAVDGAGNVYVGDTFNATIRKVTPQGVVTTIAGSPYLQGNVDAVGSDARFNDPRGVAVDSVGNVYVADPMNQTIRKVDAMRVVTTIAGTAGVTGWADLAGEYGSADGTGPAARFHDPGSVALDGSGNVFVADTQNNTIRRVTPGGVVTTLAGTAGTSGSADGTGSAALFNSPQGVATDSSGNVWVADTFNNTVRKVTPEGVVTTIAGSPGQWGSTNGTGSAARFGSPRGIAVDGNGVLFIGDSDNHVIRRIAQDGSVTTFAGTAGSSGTDDGNGAAARFTYPRGIAFDSSGNLYVADGGNHSIRMVAPNADVTTVAGTPGTAGAVDGTPAAARFSTPMSLAVDANGNVYVADWGNHAIRLIRPGSLVVTVAGVLGTAGYANGRGSAARFYAPDGIAVNASGVFIADAYNNAIRTSAWPHGDINGDGSVGVPDLVYLINSLFGGGPAPVGSGDVDGDGNVDVGDVFYLVNFLFAGGTAP